MAIKKKTESEKDKEQDKEQDKEKFQDKYIYYPIDKSERKRGQYHLEVGKRLRITPKKSAT